MQLNDVLRKFGLEDHFAKPFGNGLINNTWIVENSKGRKEFILQRVNQHVFKHPGDIAFNIRLMSDHLKQYHPGYLFTVPCQTKHGYDLVKNDAGYFRLFHYIKNSHTINVVQQHGQAYEAAKQFGKFTKILSGLDASQLKITLPGFHDLSLRYKQFEMALQDGNIERIKSSDEIIRFLQQQKYILDEFEMIKKSSDFRIRITHHDTKISNVLFSEDDKGICVIDLDTVMPGYFISDMGDMMRTCLSPVSEEEKDFSKIEIRKDFYDAIVQGYLSEMGGELTTTEKKYFLYSGKFMTYMQALRFLTDHINNDIYYGAAYEGQNFTRAGNQMVLLQKLSEVERDV